MTSATAPLLLPAELPAGPHTLVLREPESGKTVYTTPFTLADGEREVLSQPQP